MAFRLAEGLWRSFIGPSDPERLQYFLFDHLDLVALGILADRVPLTGENRALVWHGLRRLAKTRKEGLASLLRFFRIKGEAVTVRQATWQIIPLLNAAGRLGKPHWATDLLITEDPVTARECIDALLGLNTVRRKAQTASVDHFEKTVLTQCAVETDPVLVATARDLEPSVTGLAAQSLVQKYGRPAFLFVEQGEDLVGSGRGTADVDLFGWIERHQDLLVKFGGHQGAVGMTVRKSDFPALREGLFKSAEERAPGFAAVPVEPEAELELREAGPEWWASLERLEPFGQGFEIPAFELRGVSEVLPRSKRSPAKVMLKCGAFSWPAELPSPLVGEGVGWGGTKRGTHPPPSSSPTKGEEIRLVATPQATPKDDFPFKWMIHEG
jgi:single-stranded-DNA-specific exonuclease